MISDILTRIRNSIRLKRCTVEILKTKKTIILSEIFIKEDLIYEIITSNFSTKKEGKRYFLLIRLKYLGFQQIPIITNLKCISQSYFRIYSNFQHLPKILYGFGSSVVSTFNGFMLDRKARVRFIGGEIIFSIWLFIIIKLCV